MRPRKWWQSDQKECKFGSSSNPLSGRIESPEPCANSCLKEKGEDSVAVLARGLMETTLALSNKTNLWSALWLDSVVCNPRDGTGAIGRPMKPWQLPVPRSSSRWFHSWRNRLARSDRTMATEKQVQAHKGTDKKYIYSCGLGPEIEFGAQLLTRSPVALTTFDFYCAQLAIHREVLKVHWARRRNGQSRRKKRTAVSLALGADPCWPVVYLMLRLISPLLEIRKNSLEVVAMWK